MKLRISDKTLLFSVFVLLAVIKYSLISKVYPPHTTDEFYYKLYAETIFKGEPFSSFHYPPLYSLLLSFAFFSKKNWPDFMRVINVIISTGIIIPIWLIGRRLLPKSLSLIVIGIMSLWSFHLTYTRSLLSENLHVPLFLLTIFLLLKTQERNDNKANYIFSALFGASMALTYLTKYLFLVAIPPLLLLWWLKPFFDEGLPENHILDKSRILEFSAILAGFILTYSPWLIYAHYSGDPGARAMGSKFVNNLFPVFGTLKSLTLWAGFYISYIVLVLAPYLLFIFIYFYLLVSGAIKNNRPETFFIIAVTLLTVTFLATAVHHSWSASYNYPEPKYLIGRYLIHLTPLFLILFMIALNKMTATKYSVNLSFIIVCTLFCIIAIIFAREVLYGQNLFVLNRKFAVSFSAAPDANLFRFKAFSAFVLMAVLIMAATIAMGRFDMTVSKRSIIFTVSILLVIIHVSSSYKEYRRVKGTSHPAIHGRTLSEFLVSDMEKRDEKITIVYDVPDLSVKNLSFSLKFWLSLPLESKSISVIPFREYSAEKRINNGKVYLLTRENRSSFLLRYVVNKRNYYLYDIKVYNQYVRLTYGRDTDWPVAWHSPQRRPLFD